jgi:hypothetical protein
MPQATISASAARDHYVMPLDIASTAVLPLAPDR